MGGLSSHVRPHVLPDRGGRPELEQKLPIGRHEGLRHRLDLAIPREPVLVFVTAHRLVPDTSADQLI